MSGARMRHRLLQPQRHVPALLCVRVFEVVVPDKWSIAPRHLPRPQLESFCCAPSFSVHCHLSFCVFTAIRMVLPTRSGSLLLALVVVAYVSHGSGESANGEEFPHVPCVIQRTADGCRDAKASLFSHCIWCKSKTLPAQCVTPDLADVRVRGYTTAKDSDECVIVQ